MCAGNHNAGGNLAMDHRSIPSREEFCSNIPNRFMLQKPELSRLDGAKLGS